MKKILLSIVLILNTLSGISQIWCSPGSIWHFDTSNPLFNTTYTKYSYIHDTIIGGTNYNKIKSETHGANISGPINNYGYTYTSLQGSVVYFNNITHGIPTNDTLIYFGNIGSKWRVAPSLGISCSKSFIQITDSGRANVQGEILRWRKINYTNYIFFGMPYQINVNGIDTIFERIGFKHIAFQFLGFCDDGTDSATSLFRCFQDNQININATTFECTAITSINESNSNFNKISLFPNPTNSILNIDDTNKQIQKETIEIKNYLGQIVLSIPFSNQIDVSFLSDGIYIVSIKQKNNCTQHKLLINH